MNANKRLGKLIRTFAVDLINEIFELEPDKKDDDGNFGYDTSVPLDDRKVNAVHDPSPAPGLTLPFVQPAPVVDRTIPAGVLPDPSTVPVGTTIHIGVDHAFRGAESSPVIQEPNEPVDSRGMRWDKRIHASSKAFVKEGTWRNKRGVSQELLAQVEAELLGDKPSPAPVQVPPVPAAPVAEHVISSGSRPVTATIEPQTVAPPQEYNNIEVPQSTKPAHTLATFQGALVQVIAQLIAEGKIDQAYIESLKAYFQVSEMWDVLKDPAKVAELYENFCSNGLITKVD